jgi:hypothetical protein
LLSQLKAISVSTQQETVEPRSQQDAVEPPTSLEPTQLSEDCYPFTGEELQLLSSQSVEDIDMAQFHLHFPTYLSVNEACLNHQPYSTTHSQCLLV